MIPHGAGPAGRLGREWGEMIELGISGISDPVEIGAGGFGVVYRAEEADLGRVVAVKVLTGNLDEQARRRFERERRAMGTLSGHPNIVTVYRGGYTTAGNAYLVMEYLARGSLADRLKTDGPLPWPEVLRLGVQLAGAMETAHRAGVLHRDLKPGNVLVSGLGDAKLGDFGIARLQGAPETRSQVVTASLAHAPPEILLGERPDARADVYSLGSTLLELILGSAPFVRSTDESMVPILTRIAQDPPPRPSERDLPAAAFDVIERAMAKDPADRPGTAAELGRLLVAAQRRSGREATLLPIEGEEAPPPDTAPVADAPPTTMATGPASGTGPAGLTVAAPTTGPPHPRNGPSSPLPGSRPPLPPDSGDTPPPIPSDTTGTRPPLPPGTIGTGAASDPVEATASRTGAVSAPPGPTAASTRRILLPAALVLVAVLAVGGALAARGRGEATGTTTTAASPIGETTFDFDDAAATGGEPHTGTSISDRRGDYREYVALNDASGSISLLVPLAWSGDTEVGPGSDGSPFAAASPLLEGGFYGTYDQPGVSVELTRELVTDLDTALDEITDDACPDTARQTFVGALPGRVELLGGCGGGDTRLIHTVVTDEAAGVSAVVRIQAVTSKDLVAAVTVMRSLRLSDNS